jgi:acyl carrier protein
MNESDVRALAADVLGGIAPEADLASVGEDEDLREALDLDSMDFLNFVVALSQRLGRSIPEADYPKLFTLRGIVVYLHD